MGLDQYAFIREKDTEPDFYWRKHAKLHKFMEQIWHDELGRQEEINCQELILTKDMLTNLKECLEKKTLPQSEGGCFFGHQWQDESSEEYHEQDMKFCNDALTAIENGQQVVYSCWY